MKIIEPKVYVEDVDPLTIMRNLEKACRTCYRSEDKITDSSYSNLLKNCISRGHESILEHEKITVRLICDIGVYKDLTRHRHASFSIESTRYCNYGKDKFDNMIKFIRPIFYTTDVSDILNYQLTEEWRRTCQSIEDHYLKMSDLGATADQLRMILPHSTAAEVVMTANIREWKHILSLRATKHTHPSVQQVMIPLLLHFKYLMPEIFDTIEYNKDFPKDKEAELIVTTS